MVSFQWDPNAIRKLTQEVVGNLDAKIRQAVERTGGLDHHEHTWLLAHRRLLREGSQARREERQRGTEVGRSPPASVASAGTSSMPRQAASARRAPTS